MSAWFSPEWLALAVAIFGAALAIQALREATRNSRVEKIADVLMECTNRYGALIELRHTLKKDVQCGDTNAQSASRRYYHAYWNLQWDQWTFFQLGLIPHEIYADWFVGRHGALVDPNDSFGGTFEQGWTDIGRPSKIMFPDFAEFVDAVWALKGRSTAEARAEIDKLVTEAFTKGRHLRIGFVRKSLSRSS